jgi:hypothetical protein
MPNWKNVNFYVTTIGQFYFLPLAKDEWVSWDQYETHVIKIALKDSKYGFNKGIAQNRVEADWGIQKWHSDVVTGISDQDEDFYWVVAEKAKTPISAARFKELTEIPFSKFAELLRYVIDTNKGMRYSKPDDFDKYIDNEFLTEIISLAGNFGMPSGEKGLLSPFFS